jgi:hypothetical protein
MDSHNEVERKEISRSPTPEHETTVGIDAPAWLKEVDAVNDTRAQPWKQTFGNEVNQRFDRGPDLVSVKDPGAANAFMVLNNSMAA